VTAPPKLKPALSSAHHNGNNVLYFPGGRLHHVSAVLVVSDTGQVAPYNNNNT
jgi:hypothetical protein